MPSQYRASLHQRISEFFTQYVLTPETFKTICDLYVKLRESQPSGSAHYADAINNLLNSEDCSTRRFISSLNSIVRDCGEAKWKYSAEKYPPSIQPLAAQLEELVAEVVQNGTNLKSDSMHSVFTTNPLRDSFFTVEIDCRHEPTAIVKGTLEFADGNSTDIILTPAMVDEMVKSTKRALDAARHHKM